MLTLNVNCKCGKGKITCLDLIDDGDNYVLGCDTCNHTFTAHYTYYDMLCEQSEYNNQMNDDVRMLNSNGTWYYEPSNAKAEKLEELLNGAKEIHMIDDGYERHRFYQKGATFFKITYNPVHKTNEYCSYKANEDCMDNLINHFFNTAK